ncbi:HNH endonuclease signature motif containing protein [Burkholderia seminalis]|uniref:HNH endonuclease signature motif containing protein n=1 Tax=Burkholderia seminalis TaxID=488731 RepID=UPI000F59F588|nr:HNH endonuclease signature motif containing protein [Burkholderia seminalis]RQS79777.1 HNH endonuclease [Burkholderia seminalis]
MTRDELCATFVYEPETGMLRRIAGGRKQYPWRPAGKGYLVHTYRSGSIYLHQAVWLYHHGVVPPMLDHINGDPNDNRVENLRPCTNSQNQLNSCRKVSNRSGHKGVVFHANCPGKPWQAKITVDGRRISLGYYATVEEAGAAYAAGALKHAGAFARASEIS